MKTHHFEDLNQKIINSTNFQEIQKSQLLSQLLDADTIILIQDKFVYKGKKMIFKGNQKQLSKQEFSLFLKQEVTSDWYKNFIVIVNHKDVYTINEDGIINKYFEI